MLSKTQWIVSQLTRTLWVRASLFAVLAIITALIAIPLEHYLNYDLDIGIATDSVKDILNILASSMLAVTTFSLSIMVSAYTASSSVSPRATKLTQQDTTTQNVLATFIGSFLYSLVGIVALSIHAYDATGRFILFIVTIGVILLIVITILRWIEHLSQLGRLGETTDRVEAATLTAIEERVLFPSLDAKEFDPDNPPDYIDNKLFHKDIGYIQHIDIEALNSYAQENDAEISLLVSSGDFIHLNKAIACANIELSESFVTGIQSTFTIGPERSFDQDPGFGMIVLTEIASRALSQAINDPGTAIDVINRSIRILSELKNYKLAKSEADEIRYQHVRVPCIAIEQILNEMYLPIARDGAAMAEIHIAIQHALLALSQLGNKSLNDHLHRVSGLVNQYLGSVLVIDADREKINIIMQKIKEC
tara:strand:+ start:1175 stop:2437 length:1263 start_codon:yes stop_codon:yes gene_type:complete